MDPFCFTPSGSDARIEAETALKSASTVATHVPTPSKSVAITNVSRVNDGETRTRHYIQIDGERICSDDNAQMLSKALGVKVEFVGGMMTIALNRASKHLTPESVTTTVVRLGLTKRKYIVSFETFWKDFHGAGFK